MSGHFCTQVTAECPVEHSIYGYYPSLPANAFFTAWFTVLFIPNFIFGIYSKAWTYMLALCLGCAVEAIGYGGRIVLHENPWSEAGFQAQICCLILGPAFNSAAIYLTLKHIALAFGPEQSLMKPRWYTWTFILFDLVSLVLQAIGGGIAATSGDNRKLGMLGTHIMLAGIIWQVFTLVSFGLLMLHYISQRYRATRSGQPLSIEASKLLRNTKFRLFAFAVLTAYFAVLIRCIYRIPELAGGWGSKIMRAQTNYIVLEGVMIAYATFMQTAFHPAYCFPQLTGRGQQRAATGNSELRHADKDRKTPETSTSEKRRFPWS